MEVSTAASVSAHGSPRHLAPSLTIACARSDAFSSLCYKPTMATAATTSYPPSSFRFPGGTDMRQNSSLASSGATSTDLSRYPSSTSNASASASSVTDTSDGWDASHYRRLARADIRKEERKDERRRRRAELNSRSTSSSISSTVPELVGGHSRNVSTASSVSSAYTVGSLSRNPSTASTSSSRRFGAGVNVDEVIMEDEDEAEWLQDGASRSFTAGPGAYMPDRPKQRRKNSQTAPSLSSGRKKQLEAFGMGKDMRDVLEEILQMEREFVLSDTDDNENHPETAQPVQQGIFTATFDRPPRTPSPVGVPKRQSRIPMAPGAPIRGHRMSFSHSTAAPPMFLQQGHQTPRRQPPSMISGHQSSLSESHTALYLATASPAAASTKRSLSPQPLAVRKSLTFTPDKAGPSIGALRPPRFDSPGVTPSRRRGNNSPSIHHPTMDGWKFPSTTSNAATPTRPPPIDTTNIPGNFATPVGPRQGDVVAPQPVSSISPQLLWPVASLPPPLAPALFPSSPAMNTPEMLSGRTRMGAGAGMPPYSGITLGELMGSGDDIEMGGEGDDAESTAHGHGSAETGYVPVFLEDGDVYRRMRWE